MFSKSHDDILLSGLTLVTVVFLVEFDILSIETHPFFSTDKETKRGEHNLSKFLEKHRRTASGARPVAEN